jgi:methylated-DNA-[protein]-cysteine S-methyltransferase
MTVACADIETPMGRLTLAATGDGLVRIGLPPEDPDAVRDELRRRLGDVVEGGSAVEAAHHQLDEYFAGDRREFTMPLDWSLARGFRLRVLEEMFRIPYGRTVSYGELAARAGNPRAPRAAGQACATNPIPIVLPCHRVVRSDGDLNWYTGGLHYKEFLLRLEGALPA